MQNLFIGFTYIAAFSGLFLRLINEKPTEKSSTNGTEYNNSTALYNSDDGFSKDLPQFGDHMENDSIKDRNKRSIIQFPNHDIFSENGSGNISKILENFLIFEQFLNNI